jgi:hypothetical protein
MSLFDRRFVGSSTSFLGPHSGVLYSFIVPYSGLIMGIIGFRYNIPIGSVNGTGTPVRQIKLRIKIMYAILSYFNGDKIPFQMMISTTSKCQEKSSPILEKSN